MPLFYYYKYHFSVNVIFIGQSWKQQLAVRKTQLKGKKHSLKTHATINSLSYHKILYNVIPVKNQYSKLMSLFLIHMICFKLLIQDKQCANPK